MQVALTQEDECFAPHLDLGSVLGMIYEVASEVAFESFQDNAEGLQEIGQTLQEMAAHYAEVDSAGRDSFQQVLGGLS